mgnify:CR=1 FL=1
MVDEEYIRTTIQNEENIKSIEERLKKEEIKIEELEKTYAVMQQMSFRMGKVEDSVEKINQKLDNNFKEIINAKSQPVTEKSKKWDKLIDYLFYAVIGAIMLLVLTKIGLN